MPTPTRYSKVQIALHWIIMALLIFNIIAHDGIKAARDALEHGRELASSDALFADLHVYIGILILALAVLRLALRLTRGVPAAPEGPHLQQLAGHVVHWGIYVILFAMPLSGIAAWYGGADAAAEAHGILESLLYILVALHVAAALYHQFIEKDNLLSRMRPGS